MTTSAAVRRCRSGARASDSVRGRSGCGEQRLQQRKVVAQLPPIVLARTGVDRISVGALKTKAKALGRDHDLAIALWKSGATPSRRRRGWASGW